VGTSFSVVDASDAVLLTGVLQKAAGTPVPWSFAEVVDVSSLQNLGEFRVITGGLTSVPWTVRVDGPREAIITMLQFFAANSDGFEPSPLHGASHLHDAVVARGPHKGEHVDLTGGWMDAGDMLHFTQTTGFSAMLLQYAARLDAADRDALNRTADVGVRWLVKAHPTADLFIGQVGDQRDHNTTPLFRNPESDDASSARGIGTRLAYPSTRADLAGKAAAALALAADRATGDDRGPLLQQAIDWYEAGKFDASSRPPLRGGFYTSSSWHDDMATGAAALYRTTGDGAYLAGAMQYLRATDTSGDVNWDSVGAFAAADLCGLLGAPAVNDPAARDLACSKFQDALASAKSQAAKNAFGTPGEFLEGQTALNGGAGAMIAAAARAGDVSALDMATGARDYLLGRNAWGASFIIGYGLNAPRHPHHWAEAFAPGQPIGGVVNGPAPRRRQRKAGFRPDSPFDSRQLAYQDAVDNYFTSEPAIDLTASSILLLAALSPSS